MIGHSAKYLKVAVPLVGVMTLGMTGHVWAVSCQSKYYGTELVDDVTICASSVLHPSKVSSYVPSNLDYISQGSKTAWCEGRQGNGVGEWFEFQIKPGATLKSIVLFNGYQKSKKAFRENARARNVTIQTDSGLRILVPLKDVMGGQTIKFQNWHELKRIRVTINNVYSGSKYSDLCISGLKIDFEQARDYEWQQMQK